jgi:hypothetical protein
MSCRYLTIFATIFATLCAVGGAHAAPNDWAEGTAGKDDGATRDYYNRGALLPWRNQNGDWLDSKGVAQGSDAFASSKIDDTDTPRAVSWDITALVVGWQQATYERQGVLLRAAGSGSIHFRSREAPSAAEHPKLTLTTSQGTVDLPVVADTYTEPSTYRAQGDKEELRVGGDRATLLRFDSSKLPAATVTKATLTLFTHKQYGTTTVDVFCPAPGRQGVAPAFEAGLAPSYPLDTGLGGDADVVLFEDFEGASWKSNWSTHGGNYTIVDSGGGFGFAPLSGKALQIKVEKDGHYGLSMTYDFQKKTGAEPEEIYMRYYLRLASDWAPLIGGKLPGISGTYGVAGWGGRPVDGTNGWSARGLFTATSPAQNPLALHTPVGSYVYHADMKGQYGDNWHWNQSWGKEGYGGVLAPGRWYCLEQQVKMNTLGKSDGVLRAWVDGRLAFEKTDVHYRDVAKLKIERVWMNVYYGGKDPSPADMHLFIDNVVIAKRYIGPRHDPAAGPDAGPIELDGGAIKQDSGVTPADGAAPASDGSSPSADAAPARDGSGRGADDGCSCRAGAGGGQTGGTMMVLLCCALLCRWRRRARR